MTGLCGWLSNFDNPQINRRIDQAAHSLARFDGVAPLTAIQSGGGVLVCGTKSASVFTNGSIVAALWGTARFTQPTLAREADETSTVATLARAFAEKRDCPLSLLSGRFALAILDCGRDEALLAVDRIGALPLCYRTAGSAVVFGSTLDSILSLSPDPVEIDPQALYDYLYFHVIPGPSEVFKRYRRLMPGQVVRIKRGIASVDSYWSMRFTEDQVRPSSALRKGLLDVLRHAVRDASADEDRVGAFLSGGTDSSTIAGLLGEVTGEPARTYSIGFDERGFDETHFARVAAHHFGTKHHEYYVTPDDVVSAIPQIAAVHDKPFGNSSAVPTYYCAKMARDDGVRLLLGGDGGDELFGGNVRYAKQYLYSLYSDLPKWLRTSLVEPVALAVPFEAGLFGKIQRYIKTASVPMPARYDNYNLLNRLGPETVFEQDFLELVDARYPEEQVDNWYHAAHASSLINRMLALDLKYTLADNDLPKVMRSCELAGVSVRFPMLDDAVVDFAAHLSPNLKLKGTKLRFFFKEALRGFLPDEIINKTKHGFGLPFGVWIRTHVRLRELVMDSLNSLRRRSIVREAFIDELMGSRVEEHADYYGTMAWVLMMLEQWFQHHPYSHSGACGNMLPAAERAV